MKPEDLEQRLSNSFPESEVLVADLTGTQDHYEVRIIAPQFQGMSRMEQHKAVMNVFDPELKSGEIHALTIKTFPK